MMRFLISFLILWLAAQSALAQSDQPLDVAAPAQFGSYPISAGFAPDPYRISGIIGGGEVEAARRNLGPNCVGFIGIVPDVRVSLGTFLPFMRIIFISDTITTDTAMVIRDPSGNFWCNNNSFGIFNPSLDFENAVPGDYTVWISGFTPNSPVYGDLYVTTNRLVTPGASQLNIPVLSPTPVPTGFGTAQPTPEPGTTLDPFLPPSHGVVELNAGFLPDPFWRVVVGGGSLPVPPLDTTTGNTIEIGALTPSNECAGYTESQPDVVIRWSGVSTRLRLLFIASEGANAALIVRDPGGRFVCNRAFAPGYFDPMAEFINPAQGDYAIWVSSEDDASARIVGTLYVTERVQTPDFITRADSQAYGSLSGLIPSAEAAIVAQVGSPLTEPFVFSGVTGGGEIDLALENPSLSAPAPAQRCVGYYAASPTAVLNITDPKAYLRFFAIGAEENSDPTLVVRMPDGRFYCSDDSFGTRNPTINVIGNLSTGLAQIWLGTYNPGFVLASLHLTQGEANPTDPNRMPVVTGLIANALGFATPTPMPQTFIDAFPTAVDPLMLTPPMLNAADYIATPAPPASDGGAAQAAGDSILDPFTLTNYGETSLNAGFGSHTLSAIAGGEVNAAAVGSGCAGFVTRQADYRVQWGGGRSLSIQFEGVGGDTTLIVRDPAGVYRCADDTFDSVNPMLQFPAAVPGSYSIWIGSFNAGEAVPGTLTLTEFS